MKRRRLVIIILVLWLAVLACNLPSAPQAAPQTDLQQTIEAMGTPFQPPAGTDLPAAINPPPDLPPADQPPANLPPAPLPAMPTVIPGAAGHGVLIPGDPIISDGYFQYSTQPGDTVAGLAGRFGVQPDQIIDSRQTSPLVALPIGQALVIPSTFDTIQYAKALLPDSEIIFSPSSAGFSTADFIRDAGGFLSTYSEQVEQETLTGAQIVDRVAQETSTSPRLLLALLEYRSHWVFGQPADPQQTSFPIGFYASQYSGLYKELVLTSRQLTLGYYGWRLGKTVEVEFVDLSKIRMSPTVNAGTMAIAYLFSKLYNQADWYQQLYDPGSFLAFYQQSFGSPWERAAQVEPLLPDGLSQPALELPFTMGERWSFTGGPHAAWGVGSPWGGLDFAPSAVEKGCTVSRFWITAAAPGLVVRADHGVVIVDLDGDGFEQTGWVLLYLHVAGQDRVAVGTQLAVNDHIGHPSCEGGFSTGTHVHLSRKFNGEWLASDGPVPFVLSGWQAWPGARQYSGSLTRGDQVVTARPDGSHTSLIVR